ncbi:MAG: cyclase [Symploca sp. SIO2B6]|nr:cyclase [Symploca sp. SIO2B6]
MSLSAAVPTTYSTGLGGATANVSLDARQHQALLKGEILLETYPHSLWGGAVTAQMYIPSRRSHVWQEVTNYAQWVKFFPDLTHSEVLSSLTDRRGIVRKGKRLKQVARKAFFMFSAQVEIYLKAIEVTHQKAIQKIQFQMEQGTFKDFAADLALQDYGNGTLLTYSVKATPTIPVPAALIQEAMKLDLPSNMRQMRRVICGS